MVLVSGLSFPSVIILSTVFVSIIQQSLRLMYFKLLLNQKQKRRRLDWGAKLKSNQCCVCSVLLYAYYCLFYLKDCANVCKQSMEADFKLKGRGEE